MDAPARNCSWFLRIRNQPSRYVSFGSQAGRTIIGAVLKFATAVAFAFSAAGTFAQPVKFIVPFPAGGGGDSIARILGQKMSESLGNQVIIENRPGAGGVVGLETMVRAADANLTLGLLSTGALLAALVHRPDLLEGLQLVSPLGIAGMVVVSSKDATIADLLERIRRGQKAFFGAGGPGSVSHLCVAQFLKGTGRTDNADLIQYKGNAPLLVDAMAGQVDAACVDIASAIPHIKAGKLRALALTLPHPDEQLPGVPTLESVGVTGVLAGGWYAMVAPRRMSQTTLNNMAASLKKALSDPQVQGRLRKVLTDPIAVDEVGPGIADQFMQEQKAQLRPYASQIAKDNAVSPGAVSPIPGAAPSPRVADPGAKELREPARPGASVATVAPQPARDSSSRSAADIAAARTCDRQCALLVAETKCKHIRDVRENLSCLMQNGTARDDTPEICAQAKALTGCVTKKEKESARPSVASRSGGRYDSVCERNLRKIDYAMLDSRLIMAAATYDLFMKDVHWHAAKIFEPCTGSNAEAAGRYKDAMESYNKVSQHCAGAHGKLECTRWGVSGGVSDNGGNPFNNPAWYAKWKSEVDRALSNPEYSAELGSIKGSGAGTGVDAACAAGLKKIESQYAAAKHHIPARSIVVLSEANMWKAARSIEAIESQCPQSESYQAEAGRLRSQYRDIKRACDASASAGACIARLPGKEPAPVAPGNSLPPLRKESLKEDCSGANWLQCRRKECKERQGTFSTDKNGCAWCIADAGNWTRCPAGSGGVSSGQ